METSSKPQVLLERDMTRSLWLDISGTTVLGCLLGCGRVLIFLLLRSISLFRFSVLKLSLGVIFASRA